MTNSGLTLPPDALSLARKGKHLTVGNELGWLGFPAIPSASLCFFSGRISAWVETLEAYLVDGNAINGVSGGPAFAAVGEEIHLIGIVSAYMPNRATGESLPGLAIVRSVEQLHNEVAQLTSFEQAKSEETPPTQEIPPPAAESTARGSAVGPRTAANRPDNAAHQGPSERANPLRRVRVHAVDTYLWLPHCQRAWQG